MLIEFEDTKQNNKESNEASDIGISQLRTKQHDSSIKIKINSNTNLL